MRKDKIKFLFLLSAFMLTSNFMFAVSNSSDNFNGSSTIINSFSNTSDNFNGSSTITNSISTGPVSNSSQSSDQDSNGTTVVQSTANVPGTLGAAVSKLASLFDAIEGGSTPQTTAQTQQEAQQDLFAEPGSTEATTAGNEEAGAVDSDTASEKSDSKTAKDEETEAPAFGEVEAQSTPTTDSKAIKVSSTRDYY